MVERGSDPFHAFFGLRKIGVISIERLRKLPAAAVSVGAQIVRSLHIRLYPQRGAGIGNGFVVFALVVMRCCAVQIGLGPARPQTKRGIEIGNGPVLIMFGRRFPSWKATS
jgi:hypothetical protein